MNWLIIIGIILYVGVDMWYDRINSRRITNLEWHINDIYSEIDYLNQECEDE
jgi:hypothetical protein